MNFFCVAVAAQTMAEPKKPHKSVTINFFWVEIILFE